jgi:excisionase family DNA binding protein
MVKHEQKLFRLSQAARELGLHPITVRRWIKAGRIAAIQVGREVRIPRTEIEKIVGSLDGRLLVLYGRVSGHGQKADLDTPLERLQDWASSARPGKQTLVLSEIGSGLKARRRNLQRLLKLVVEDKVAEIAITSDDRLTRFGQEYLSCFLPVLV